MAWQADEATLVTRGLKAAPIRKHLLIKAEVSQRVLEKILRHVLEAGGTLLSDEERVLAPGARAAGSAEVKADSIRVGSHRVRVCPKELDPPPTMGELYRFSTGSDCRRERA